MERHASGRDEALELRQSDPLGSVRVPAWAAKGNGCSRRKCWVCGREGAARIGQRKICRRGGSAAQLELRNAWPRPAWLQRISPCGARSAGRSHEHPACVGAVIAPRLSYVSAQVARSGGKRRSSVQSHRAARRPLASPPSGADRALFLGQCAARRHNVEADSSDSPLVKGAAASGADNNAPSWQSCPATARPAVGL